jgi:hypothetical protein
MHPDDGPVLHDCNVHSDDEVVALDLLSNDCVRSERLHLVIGDLRPTSEYGAFLVNELREVFLPEFDLTLLSSFALDLRA